MKTAVVFRAHYVSDSIRRTYDELSTQADGRAVFFAFDTTNAPSPSLPGLFTFSDDDLKEQIAAEVGTRPPFALEAFKDVETDVRQSIGRLQANPYLVEKNRIRGFVYDVKTGALDEVA